MFNFTAIPPLSVYLHMPWCVRKCPYCDFNSHEARSGIPEDEYIDALVADLEQDLPSVWGRTVESVFIGGGTPSLFSAAAINTLLCALRARLPLVPDAEITLEANPGTVDRERFCGFRDAGINRLSLGIQSFQDDLLQAIGRIHTGSEAAAAIEAASHAGFDNINLDLMFGLPGQSIEQAMADLDTALALQPAHISWYELTIEPNTWFYLHPPQQTDDATLWEMQEAGRTRLQAAGYTRYEVSAHALPDRQCRHNLNYWKFGDYLGIGAGAHAKITDAATQTIHRMAKVKHPRSYLEGVHSGRHISHRTALTANDTVLEFAMNALRLDRGFSAAAFTAATGLPFSLMEGPVALASAAGLLVKQQGVIHTTARGYRYLNELLQYWLPEAPPDANTG